MISADIGPRWIELEGAVNARDLGGTPLASGGAISAGRLLRSDNLQDLSAADIEQLIAHRAVSAVVDLRTDVELELEGPGPLAGESRVVIEHRSLYPEFGDRTDVEVDAIVPWRRGVGGSDIPGESPTVQTYMGYLEHRPDSIVGALRTIAAPPGGGATLVHCAAGKDRTGLVVAMALEVAGARREAIVADYVATGQRIVAIIDRLASTPTYARDMTRDDPSRHTPRPETMHRILQLLDERHGGASGWLMEHGMQGGELDALSVQLTAA